MNRLVELLIHPDKSVAAPALRAVGNVLTGDDVQTQVHVHIYTSVCTCLSLTCTSIYKFMYMSFINVTCTYIYKFMYMSLINMYIYIQVYVHVSH